MERERSWTPSPRAERSFARRGGVAERRQCAASPKPEAGVGVPHAPVSVGLPPPDPASLRRATHGGRLRPPDPARGRGRNDGRGVFQRFGG